MFTPDTPFLDVARYFGAVHDARARAMALEFLTTPASQDPITRSSNNWEKNRRILISFIAYFYMVGQLSSEKLRGLPLQRQEEEDAYNWAIQHYSQKGFMNFPPTTFTKDTIDYLQHCEDVILASEPMQDHRQIATLNLLSSVLLQFFTAVLHEGARGAKGDSGVNVVTEAARMVHPLLNYPDEEYRENAPKRPLTVFALGIGDRVQYKDNKRGKQSIEIVEVSDSARRGLIFTVAPPDSDDSGLEREITAEQMEEIIRVGRRL